MLSRLICHDLSHGSFAHIAPVLRAMRWADFAARYPREPYGGKVFEEKRQVLLESPREFAAFFGRLLHDRLMGEDLGVTLQEFDELWAEYVDWNNHYLGRTIRTLETLGPSGKRAEPLMEFGFHHLGVQVKTALSEEAFRRYDSTGIVFLDSSRDFGNTVATRTRKRSSVVSSQPWPGLIAAHFCLALTDGPQMAQYRKASVAALFDSARAVWRTTAKGTRSGVRRAQKIVTERVLTAFAAAEKAAPQEAEGI